jgi:hypothetical protein
MSSTAMDIRVGQHLSLREGTGLCLEFTILPPGEPGREVLEVGEDHVVLRGEGPATRSRYAKYLLKPSDPGPGTAPAAA